MKIVIETPSRSEAIVKKDPDKTIIIPRFTTSAGQRSVLYVAVTGDKGAERRFVLSVSGKDGSLSVHDVSRELETKFDSLGQAPEAVPPAEVED